MSEFDEVEDSFDLTDATVDDKQEQRLFIQGYSTVNRQFFQKSILKYNSSL